MMLVVSSISMMVISRVIGLVIRKVFSSGFFI